MAYSWVRARPQYIGQIFMALASNGLFVSLIISRAFDKAYPDSPNFSFHGRLGERDDVGIWSNDGRLMRFHLNSLDFCFRLY